MVLFIVAGFVVTVPSVTELEPAAIKEPVLYRRDEGCLERVNCVKFVTVLPLCHCHCVSHDLIHFIELT